MNVGHITYVRKLIIAFALSGFLNIILLSGLLYWFVKEPQPLHYFQQNLAASKPRPPQACEPSFKSVIREFRALSLYQLFRKLSSTTQVECGYAERDLAVACLASFHHFDVMRALGSKEQMQTRIVTYGRYKSGSLATITLYPQLSDEDYVTLKQFAEKEKWPYTAQGLFLLLKSKEQPEASLVSAFYRTHEFSAIEAVMGAGNLAVDKNEILSLLLQGDWQMVVDYTLLQPQRHPSEEMRQKLLVEYIEKGSIVAANILLRTDNAFAIRKLDNNHIIKMLQLLTEKNENNEKFAIALLKSPRSDDVWQMAAERLYEYAGEKSALPVQREVALSRFTAPKAVPAIMKGMEKLQIMPEKNVEAAFAVKKMLDVKSSPQQTATEIKDTLYIVQEGDNLWKLSRRFNVNINSLRSHNRLKSDALRPGSPLRVPVAQLPVKSV